MAQNGFDYRAFRASVDAARRNRGMTWRQVAKEAKVSASTLTRMAQGSKPDVDTIASLAAWASIDPASYFPAPEREDPLAAVTKYLRRDPKLSPEAADALEQLFTVTYEQLARPTLPSSGGTA